MKNSPLKKTKILVVDHHLTNRRTTTAFLTLQGYEVFESESGTRSLGQVKEINPDLILLETKLPGLNGFEVCRRLKEESLLIPLIFLTVSQEPFSRIEAIKAGCDDFFHQPFDPLELSRRVRSLAPPKRESENVDHVQQVLISLANVAESHDLSTGDHCKRCAGLAQAFGKFLKLSEDDMKILKLGGFIHDVGKIGIPDEILQKVNPHTPEEWEIMKQHVIIGEKICQPVPSLQGILPIIRSHHERWDGSGYPDGLKGDKIPYLAQIFQMIDIYDALISERPYKTAFSTDKALQIMAQEAEKGWRNPEIVSQFIRFIRSRVAVRSAESPLKMAQTRK
ncbi:MAG: HD domain-containing phosphohydrolase [Microcoleaceae cyanobacterium]